METGSGNEKVLPEGSKEQPEPQQEADDTEWHTTGSRYLQQRVARGVFGDDDLLQSMAFGTVVGWLPVEVADFISEHTDKPAALWHIKFDDEQMGEEDLEEFEVKRAMKDYKETLEEQNGTRKPTKKRSRLCWSKPDDNYEEEDNDGDFDEDVGNTELEGDQKLLFSRSHPRRQATSPLLSAADRPDFSQVLLGGQNNGLDGHPESAPGSGQSIQDVSLRLRMVEAELESSRRSEAVAEQRRREAEERCAALTEALAAEKARRTAQPAPEGDTPTTEAGESASGDGKAEVESFYRKANRELEARVLAAQEEARGARAQAREELAREVQRVRLEAGAEVARVRRQAEEQLLRVRRQGDVEAGRVKRKAEADVEAVWRSKLRRTGGSMLEELSSLRALAKVCFDAGRKPGRVLDHVAKEAARILDISPECKPAVTTLMNFLGRYSLLLAHPPLSVLATITQLAWEEPPASQLAMRAREVINGARAAGAGERKGWEEVRDEWLVQRVGGSPHAVDACTRVLGLHLGGVRAVAVSEDGTTLASGGSDKVVKVWDAATGQQRGGQRRGHSGEVTCLAVSADGGVIVSGGKDKMVRVWARAGSEAGHVTERELRGHMGEVTALVVLHGQGFVRVVSGSTDETLRVWAVQTGEEIRGTPRRHPEGVTCLALGQQEGVFVSGGRDGMVRMWSASGAYTRWKQPQVEHSKPVVAVAACEDHVASVDEDGRVLIWSLQLSQLLVDTPPSRHHPTVAAAMTSIPGLVVTGGLDSSLRLWEVPSWSEHADACWGHAEEVTAVACGPNGMVVTGSADCCVRVWDTNMLPRRPRKRVQDPLNEPQVLPPAEPAQVVSVHRQKPGVVTASGWRLPQVNRQWHHEQATPPTEAHDDAVSCVAVSEDGTVAVSGSRDSTVKVWDTRTGSAVAHLRGHKKRVTSVAVSRDGKRVVSGGADKTVRVWCLDGELCCFSGHKMVVLSVALSPCGGMVVSGSKESKDSVRVWDVARKEKAQGPTDGSSGGAAEVWFSADGLAYGSRNLAGRVTHWLCSSGAPAPERDPAQPTAAVGYGEKKAKSHTSEQLECTRGQHKVVAEEDLVLVYALGRPDAAPPLLRASEPSSSPRPSATESPTASKPLVATKPTPAAEDSDAAKQKSAKERCCGLYRARGAVKAVRAGRGGVICAGCESGDVLILRSTALASSDVHVEGAPAHVVKQEFS